MIDLDEYLFPKNSPITQPVPDTSVEFDLKTDSSSVLGYHMKNLSVTTAKIADLAVTSAKINNFSFNKGTGGTLTLGGTSNGNGLMQVLNSSGGTVVNINNQGISVTGGSINVVNSAGSTIMDPTGLVSITNFVNGNYNASNYISNSVSTATGTVSGSDLTFTLSRNANVLFLASVVCGLNPLASTYSAIVYIGVDGTLQNPPMKCNFIQTDGPTFTTHYFVSLGSGAHTANIRWTPGLSGSTAEMWERRLTYLVLGN